MMADSFKPVIAERTYPGVSIEQAWTALTDPVAMKQWFFQPMEDFKPEVGFETQFNIHCEGDDYLHLWKIIEVEPQSRIVYDWRYDGTPGESTLTWELAETADGTIVRVTHLGFETFPQDNPVFSRESTQGGWDYFVHESLKGFLDGSVS